MKRLIVVLLAAAALCCACAPGGTADETTKPMPGGATVPVSPADSGRFAWPEEYLPADFPRLCDEVDYLTVGGKHSVVIGVTDAGWDEYHPFVMTLCGLGWGSVRDAYIRAYYETQPDSYLGIAEGMEQMYESTEREKYPVFYEGRMGDAYVWCSMDSSDSDSTYRCVIYLDYLTDGMWYTEYLSDTPACIVRVNKGWNASQSDGQLFVSYSYDAGRTMWSLSALPAGASTPQALREAYMSAGDTVYTGFETSFAGVAYLGCSFTAKTADGDLECVYYVWEMPDGSLWQCTLTATDHNIVMARTVLTEALEHFGVR